MKMFRLFSLLCFLIVFSDYSCAGNEQITASINTQTVVTSPTDRARKTLGVGEIVILTFVPEQVATWSKVSGEGSLTTTSGKWVSFQAPDAPGTTKIKAVGSKNGATAEVTFTTVKPSGVIMERIAVVSTSQDPLAAGMTVNVYITPANVNFSRIKVAEDTCPAVAEGYFEESNNDPLFAHDAGDWVPMSGHVEGKGTQVKGTDNISDASYGAPYSAGKFTWSIPWKYFINGDKGEFVKVDQVTELKKIDQKWVLMISKGGASVSVSTP